mmetsp:Transcript_2960/g.2675  ORF Transcript_2960/g.2675 Transcript_2960/m.2675 type:complete len:106 (-) Transcript_2960:27-344(-)
MMGILKGLALLSFQLLKKPKKALSSSGVELDGRALVVNASLPKSKLPRRDSGDRYEKRDSAGRDSRYDNNYREDRGFERRGGDYGGRDNREGGYGRRDSYRGRDF